MPHFASLVPLQEYKRDLISGHYGVGCVDQSIPVTVGEIGASCNMVSWLDVHNTRKIDGKYLPSTSG